MGPNLWQSSALAQSGPGRDSGCKPNLYLPPDREALRKLQEPQQCYDARSNPESCLIPL